MNEVYSKGRKLSQILFPDKDPTITDFIRSHVDSFFPLSDPNPDTDNDTVNDGREKNGYNFNYLTQNHEEVNRTVMKADPLSAFKYDNGTWVDFDRDNIIDIIEYKPERIQSGRFDDLENIEQIHRFFEYYAERDEDVLREQFNPYIKDVMAPSSIHLSVKNDLTWGADAGAKVHLEFFDPGGIDFVRIENEDQGNSKKIEAENLHHEAGKVILQEWLDIDGANDYWSDGWDLSLTIVDQNGNELHREKHVEDKLNQVWQDFTDWLRDHLWEAVDKGMERAVELADHMISVVKDKVSSMFSNVVDPIVDGLKDWAKGIKTEMNNFFTKLSDWDDGDGHVKPTMQAGTGLMLSFMGQQDKAEEITNTLSWVMNFIKPFQKYLSPMGAMKTVTSSVGGEIPAVGNLLDMFESVKNEAIRVATIALMDIVAETCELGGMTDLPSDVEIRPPSLEAIEIFVEEAGIESDLVNGILEGAKESLAKHSGSLIGLVDFSVTAIGVMLAVSSIFGGGGIAVSSLFSMAVGSLGAFIEAVMLLSSFGIDMSFKLGMSGLGLAIGAGMIEVLAISKGESTTASKLVVVSDIGMGFGSLYYLTQKYG